MVLSTNSPFYILHDHFRDYNFYYDDFESDKIYKSKHYNVFYYIGFLCDETEMMLIQISKQHNITFVIYGTYSGSGVIYFNYNTKISETTGHL